MQLVSYDDFFIDDYFGYQPTKKTDTSILTEVSVFIVCPVGTRSNNSMTTLQIAMEQLIDYSTVTDLARLRG